MAWALTVQCHLVYQFIKCALPGDTIDVDLKVHTLKGIHMFKKDYKSQISKCSPWRAEVQPYPFLKKKMVEFICQREAVPTPVPTGSTIPNLGRPQRREPWYHLPSKIGANSPNQERSIV